LRRNFGGKNLAERGKGIDNLLNDTSSKRNNDAFRQLNTEIKRLRDEDFDTYNLRHFIQFKANLKYVQVCSGLNQLEFTQMANINRNALSEANQFPTTIPMHSFIKCYSIMRHYLRSIDFCDMFLIDFSIAFPYLKTTYERNRTTLGKSITGFKTRKRTA
jgi:hypothetical protein